MSDYFTIRQRIAADCLMTAAAVEAAVKADVMFILNNCAWVQEGKAAEALTVLDQLIATNQLARTAYNNTRTSTMLTRLAEIFDEEPYDVEVILTDLNTVPTEIGGIDLATGEFFLPLANGYQIRSGWIDKADPGALPAGDYLSIINERGEQVFYMETADLLAPELMARDKLNQMLQACLGLGVTNGLLTPHEEGLTPPP